MKTKDFYFQCSAAQTLNYQNLFQFSGTCDYCSCADQVNEIATTAVCQRFDTDCDGLIWQDWGQCVLPEGFTCGVGSRSRLRQCGAYTSFDDVKNMCYDPWVKRNPGAGELATNENYYETEACVVQCPAWGPWTPCSAAPGGVGVQMRFDQSNPANQDIRQCSISADGPKADEVHYGPCNTLCGVGFRQKITYSFLGGAAIVTTEECDTGVACAPVVSTCPGVDPVVSTVAPTAAPVDPSEDPITKPVNPVTNAGTGVTINPVVSVDPVNPGEVSTDDVKALIGSMIAVIFVLML